MKSSLAAVFVLQFVADEMGERNTKISGAQQMDRCWNWMKRWLPPHEEQSFCEWPFLRKKVSNGSGYIDI